MATTQNYYTKLQGIISDNETGYRFIEDLFSSNSSTLFSNEWIGGLYLKSPSLTTPDNNIFELKGTSIGNPFILDNVPLSVQINSETGLVLSASVKNPSQISGLLYNAISVKLIKYSISLKGGTGIASNGVYTLDYNISFNLVSELPSIAALFSGLKSIQGGEIQLNAEWSTNNDDDTISLLYSLQGINNNYSSLNFDGYTLHLKSLSFNSTAHKVGTGANEKWIPTNEVQLEAQTTMQRIAKELNLYAKFVLATEVITFIVDVNNADGTEASEISFNDLLEIVPKANLHNTLPTELPFFNSFGLKGLKMHVDLSSGKPKLQGYYIALGTPPSKLMDWVIIPPDVIVLNEIDLNFSVTYGSNGNDISATLLGKFDLGGDTNHSFNISASYPDYIVRAFSTWPTNPGIPLNTITTAFKTTATPPFAIHSQPAVESVKLTLSPKDKSYKASLDISADTTLSFDGISVLTLENIGFDISYLNKVVSGDLYGTVKIGTEIDLGLSASYDGADQEWKFNGSLEKSFSTSIYQLLTDMDYSPKSWLNSVTLNIQKLDLSIDKKSANSTYKFDLDADWTLDIPNINQTETLETKVHFTNSTAADAKNSISATADFFGCKLTVELDLKGSDKTYSLSANLDDDIIISGTYNSTTKTAALTITKSPSLGQVLTFLVKTADDGMDLILPAPWDLLNDIKIPPGLEVIYDFENKSISIDVPTINLDIVVVKIDSLKATYIPKHGTQKKQVLIELTGSALGEPFSPSWNALNPQSAPKPPGKKAPLDLKFLGVGQHVAPSSTASMNTVTEAIEGIAAAFNNTGKSTYDPTKNTKLNFDSNAGWLIGADFTIEDTFGMGIIFLDPLLYGMLIDVKSKPNAKPFGGLKFEILYKKVNDTTGMYYIALTLPDIMRHLQFGEVAVTLPNLKLWVYTDGSFKIDIGYPYHNKWSDSFALEVFPFIGKGGFYFGVLKGADVNFLPNTNGNGSFNPIIEVGLALRVGLGKDFHEGMISAGISLTVAGTFQGMFTYYHPAKGGEKSLFYTMDAMLAIIGRIYGSINFAIISANLNVTASISARATIVEYQPIHIVFSAYVSVELTVSIHVVFFTIHIPIGFHKTVSDSFTVGHASLAPWEQNSPHSPSLLAMDLVSMGAQASDSPLTANDFDFSTPIENAGTIKLMFAPHYTTSGGNAQAVFMTYIDTKVKTGKDSFSQLGTAMVQWLTTTALIADGKTTMAAINAGDGTNKGTAFLKNQTFTAAQIGQLKTFFTANRHQPLVWQQAKSFLENFLKITINLQDPQRTNAYHGTVFPMLPNLEFTTSADIDIYGEFKVIEQNVTFQYQASNVSVTFQDNPHIFATSDGNGDVYHFYKENGKWKSNHVAALNLGNNQPAPGIAFVNNDKLYYWFKVNTSYTQITQYVFDGTSGTLTSNNTSAQILNSGMGNGFLFGAVIFKNKPMIAFASGQDGLFTINKLNESPWNVTSPNADEPGNYLAATTYKGAPYICYSIPTEYEMEMVKITTYIQGKWQYLTPKTIIGDLESINVEVYNDLLYLVTTSFASPNLCVQSYDGTEWKIEFENSDLSNLPDSLGILSTAIVGTHEFHISYFSKKYELIDLCYDGSTWTWTNVGEKIPQLKIPNISDNVGFGLSSSGSTSELNISITTADKGYHMANINYDGTNWTFETLHLTAHNQFAFNNTNAKNAYNDTELQALNTYFGQLKTNNVNAANANAPANPSFNVATTSTAELIFMDFISMMNHEIIDEMGKMTKELTATCSKKSSWKDVLEGYGLDATQYNQVLLDNREASLQFPLMALAIPKSSYVVTQSNVQAGATMALQLQNIITQQSYTGVKVTDIQTTNPNLGSILSVGEIIDIPAFTLSLPNKPSSPNLNSLLAIGAFYQIDMKTLVAAQFTDAASPGKVVDNLFSTSTPLLVQGIKQIQISEIISRLEKTFTNLAGMIGRFMLHGLQLPTPANVVAASNNDYSGMLTGLYQLTQQQLGVSSVTNQDTVKLSQSAPLSSLSLDDLTFKFSQNDLNTITAFDITPPTSMNFTESMAVEMYQTHVKHFTIHGKIQLATPVALFNGFKSNNVGTNVLWKVPAHISQVVSSTDNPYTFQLFSKTEVTKQTVKQEVLQTLFFPTTLIKFQVRRAEELAKPGTFVPNTYEIHSVEAASMDMLKQLYDDLDVGTNVQMRIMYPDQPIRNSYETPTQLLDGGPTVAGTDFFFVQSNLSDISDPNPDPTITTPGFYQKETLKYLMEAGAEQTGGYFMYYKDPNSDKGLPEHLFSAKSPDTELVLSISITADSSTSFSAKLASYHNYIAYQGQVNSGHQNFYLTGKNPANNNFDPAIEHMEAVSPPGTAGFAFNKPPAVYDPSGPLSTGDTLAIDAAIENLFHMISFNIAANDSFNASQSGQPIGPVKENSVKNTFPVLPDNENNKWIYDGLVSVYPWLKNKPAQIDTNLPDPAENPYIANGKTLQFEYNWVDLFGNTLFNTPQKGSDIIIGYTDPIIGISEWPHLMSNYQIQKNSTAQTVSIQSNFSLNYGPFTPSASRKANILSVKATQGLNTPEWVQKAQNSFEKYKQIINQYSASSYADAAGKPDMEIQIGSTIEFPGGLGSLESPFSNAVNSVEPSTFLDFAYQTYVYLKGIASSKLLIQPYQVSGERKSINDVATSLGFTLQAEKNAFLLANEEIAQEIKTATSVNIPYYTNGNAEKPLKHIEIASLTNSEANVTIEDFVSTWKTKMPFFEVLNPQFAGQAPTTVIPSGVTVFIPINSYIVNKGNQSLKQIAAQTGVSKTLLQELNSTYASGSIPLGTTISIPIINTSIKSIVVSAPSDAPFAFITTAAAHTDFATDAGISTELFQKLNPSLSGSNNVPIGTTVLIPVSETVANSTNLITGNEDILTALNPTLTVTSSGISVTQSTPVTVVNVNGQLKAETILNAVWQSMATVVDHLGTSESLFYLFNPNIDDKLKLAVNTIVNVPKILNGSASQNASITDFSSIVSIATSTTQSAETFVQSMGTDLGLFTKYNPSSALIVKQGTNVFVPCGSYLVSESGKTLDDIASEINYVYTSDELKTILPLLNPSISGNISEETTIFIPTPKSIAIETSETLATNTHSLFELEVKIQARRNSSCTFTQNTDGITPDDVQYQINHINPNYQSKNHLNNPHTGPTQSLTGFAEELEQAMPGFKVATAPASESNSESRFKEIWLVNIPQAEAPSVFDSQSAISYSYTDSNGQFYGIPPLSNYLVSTLGDNIQLKEYTTGQNLENSTSLIKKQFKDVNMDALMKNFITAVDGFLLPEFAVPAYQLEANGTDTSKAYSNILSNKDALAEAIANQVQEILGTNHANTPTEVIAKLKQELQIRLSNAYAFDAIGYLPLSTTVTLPSTENKVVLHGKPSTKINPGVVSTLDLPLSISPSNIELKEGETESTLTFLISTKQSKKESYIPVTFNFQINKIEHNLSTPFSNDITVGDWLNFVIPFEETSDLVFNIPLLARDYPKSPVLTQQQPLPYYEQIGGNGPIDMNDEQNAGTALPPAYTKLQKAISWRYEFSYAYDQDMQDTLKVGVSPVQTSTPPEDIVTETVLPSGPNLLNMLLQFEAVYPQIKADLDKYLVKTPNNAKSVPAMQSLAYLINEVTLAYKNWAPQWKSSYEFDVTTNENFELHVDPKALNFTIDVLKRTNHNSNLKPPVLILNGYIADYTDTPGKRSISYENSISKESLSTLDGVGIKNRLIRFDQTALDIFNVPFLKGNLSVTRNETLVENVTTNPAFYYQSPLVEFANHLHPTLAPSPDAVALYLSATGDEPKIPKNILEDLLAQFLWALNGSKAGSLRMQITCNYAYVPGNESGNIDDLLKVKIPVLMLPPNDLTIQDPTKPYTELIIGIKKALEKWFTTERPTTNKAYFQFDFAVFTKSKNKGAGSIGGSSYNMIPTLLLKGVLVKIKDIDTENWS